MAVFTSSLSAPPSYISLGESSSPFRAAIDEFLNSYPKNRQPKFVRKCLTDGEHVTEEDVRQSVAQVEKESSNKTSTKIIRKVLEPVITAMSDYSGILDVLCQADPMPSAVIWGSLKAVIECSKRYLDLYSQIKTQLNALTERLARLSKYEKLFGHSAEMQDVLRASYVNILRFWSKVVEECDRSAPVAMIRSVTSISTKRLDEILENLADDADNIARLVPIIQEELHRDQLEETAKERRKASLARQEMSAWIREQRKERRHQDEERRQTRYRDVDNWLRRGLTLNESNFRHQARGVSALKGAGGKTCGWLLENGEFQSWLSLKSKSSRIWLTAPPGTGKSVLCAFIIGHLKSTQQFSGIAYQYFRFDEQCPPLQCFLNIASQLFEQLFEQLQDVPDNLHGFVRKSNGDPENIRSFIESIVSEMPSYILIDGLDEPAEWSDGAEAIQFFEELTQTAPHAVKLWCSSQDRKWIREGLEGFQVIRVDETHNSHDIKEYLGNSLRTIRSLDVDPGTKTLVLEDLISQAHGNFLWASLMVGSISTAATLEGVQELIQNGLPKDYEVYYDRKLRSIKPECRPLASKILSCIVYAKRPLYLKELCEAVGMCSTDHGKNLSKKRTLFKDMVLELCAPLVEVREVENDESRNVCSLTHGSVRSYLIKKRSILQESSANSDCSISNTELADICLKYLSQPRYRRLLSKKDDTFYTTTSDELGEDIRDHQLLGYAAKFWDRHLDEVQATPERFEKVHQFIISRQFLTALQVQSLLVEGQFKFWFNAARVWAGPHLRRVFPRWFSTGHDLGKSLSQQYYSFVGEWGYFLDEYASSGGICSGELDRCLWTCLGQENFLHKAKSRFKSFVFTEKTSPEDYDLRRYFDSVDSQGNEIQVLELQRVEGDDSQWNVECHKYSLDGHRPKLRRTQAFLASRKHWNLYDSLLRTNIVGRPAPVFSTSDFKYLRIGSQIFSSLNGGDFVPVTGLNDGPAYFEDLASNGHYFAISTRQRVSERDLYSTGLDDLTMQNFEDFFSAAFDATDPNSSSATTSAGDKSDGASSVSDSQSSANSSRTSLSIKSSIGDTAQDLLREELDSNSLQDDSDSELLSIETNSARESWSEGSTEYHSDETDDEDQWNDWGSGASDVDIKDSSDFDDSDESASETSSKSKSASKDDDSDLPSQLGSSRAGDSDDGSSDSSDEASFVESQYSQSANSEASSEEENEGGAQLEALLADSRAARPCRGCPQVSLQIFSTESGSAVPVFQFFHFLTTILVSSPPVFHPSASLVVWPLGGGEILFADFIHKTYFTRTLRCSAPRSCHVFIQAHFSSDGHYLHLAALEARQDEEPIEGGPKPPLRITLQVSTHRLSARKTARSPPRLCFRTAVPLGTTDAISVSRLPYTLSWTPTDVYLSHSNSILEVIKIPLFRPSPLADSDPTADSNPTVAQVCAEKIFLPRSTKHFLRHVHYFPPSPAAKSERRDQATVIIGSQVPLPLPPPTVGSKGVISRKHDTAPPMGFYLQERAQMGGWKKMEGVGVDDLSGMAGVGRRRGGKLQGKFEKFDRVEDCDIVPYFF
ncbi:hypothetical protein K432DRAFT_433750 [Lepidopterella palustris CBS 459.81]|uniref:NACHT domain-containing protein n=1 Tax=Lepidopterella palustris CBS 459.81 TaxID=1314670 RepID=A0A8E2JGS5_9PEZI|nr:hypothetical protein K432DRAFT_433750 [Lepidopterella palustris CBS 459.81]